MAVKHPEKLGKYVITGILGQGAMGVVYRSVDPVIQRPVAIKTIHKQLIGDDPSGASATTRFRNEAQAVGRLLHPGIVAIYEYGEDDTTAYIAMELVQGRTLAQVMEANPRLPEPDVLRIMDQLLDALECAHQHGVWHRDIKPANLLITAAGQVKVTDFGIARIESVALTQVTSTIGTPGYMAPEQYMGSGIDHRVDLFACGVMLYRMLTGEQPFKGTVESVMYQILNKEPLPPSQVAGALRPAFYDSIVAQALAKDKTQRYSSAAAFKAALAHRVEAIPADEAQTTVIINMHPVAEGPAPAPISPALQSQQSLSPGTTTPTGWDPTTLAHIEQALVSFVGPMAKVLVKQAAKAHFDLPGLTHAVSQQLGSEQDRTRFLAKLALTGGGTVGTRPPTSAPSSPATQPTAGHTAADALTPETIAHALKVMTSQIGPIAAVMVKKAQAKASSRAQFLQLLAEHADGPTERERLSKALTG